MPHSLKLIFAEAEIETLASEYCVAKTESEQKQLDEEREVMKLAKDAGQRGQLTRAEFVRIARWKSQRPLQRYQQNPDEQVEAVTQRAFALQNDSEKVIALTELRGVKVRTATAILHMCFPTSFPLLDVWAMVSLGVGRQTTEQWDELDWLRIWPSYIDVCRAIAARNPFDLRTIDRAVWAFGEEKESRRGYNRSAI